MADLEIRSLSIEDLDDLAQLEEASFSEAWSRESFRRELEANFTARYFGVFFQGRLIAYIGYWLIMDEGHIANIAVHPLFRGRGIGEALLGYAMAHCRGESANKMTLEVRKSNTAARSLYEKMNFKNCGVRPGYYSNGEDAVIMWANIKDLPE